LLKEVMRFLKAKASVLAQSAMTPATIRIGELRSAKDIFQEI